MTAFPQSPRVLRGAIVRIDLFGPPTVIIFQYNPDKLTRTLQAQAAGDGGAHSEAMRLKGAPIETIKLEAELDATDQLEVRDPIATRLGIHPQLAALETLVYPASGAIQINAVLSAFGLMEIVPPLAPMTLFIWGVQRVVPVRVTDFTITEEAYDPKLNPIRATVSLGLRVLSYNDVGPTHPAFWIYMTNQVVKEAFAVIATANTIASAATGGPLPF